jgi:hypothetical protein
MAAVDREFAALVFFFSFRFAKCSIVRLLGVCNFQVIQCNNLTLEQKGSVSTTIEFDVALTSSSATHRTRCKVSSVVNEICAMFCIYYGRLSMINHSHFLFLLSERLIEDG